MKYVLFLLLMAASVVRGSDAFREGDFGDSEFFPVLPWSPFHGWDGKASDSEKEGLQSIADCGFNMAGFVQKQDLPDCEKLGLSAILLPDSDELPPKYWRKWRELSPAEVEARVEKIIQASGTSPAIMGYFITDEPGTADFPALAKAVNAVRRRTPGKLAYINLFPNYATLGAPDTSQLGAATYEEYLERFIKEVKPQVLSYDNYMVQYSNDLENPAQAASYFLNIEQVRLAGKKHNLPCLQIVASNQLRPGRPIPTPANLLLQANTTLAAGFRGVTWYNYYGRKYRYAPVDDDGQKTDTWYSLREVNRQVRALAPVLVKLHCDGVYYTSPAPEKTLKTLPGEVVREVQSTCPMMIGEFSTRSGVRWVMLVNLSLSRSCKFTVTPQETCSWKQVSAAAPDPRPFQFAADGCWLVPGGAILLEQQTKQ